MATVSSSRFFAFLTSFGPRFRIATAATIVIAGTLASMLVLTLSRQDELAARDRAAAMAATGQALTSAVDQAGRFALAQAETVARRPAVQKALAAGDRAALRELSEGTWSYLAQQAGVSIFGFHSADLRYLLRVHKPESFGDDISLARPMVLAANKTRRAQVGIEIGVTGIVGVRGIAVVRQGGDLAGTMEVGLDLQPILERVKTVTNAESAVVLSRSLAGLPGGDSGAGDLFVSTSTDDRRFAELLRAGTIRVTREPEIRSLTVDGVDGAILLQPLVDFSGRLVGDLVAVASFPERAMATRRLTTDLTVAAIVGGILAYALFCVLAFGACPRREDEA